MFIPPRSFRVHSHTGQVIALVMPITGDKRGTSLAFQQGEVKRSTFAETGFHPDSTLVPAYNLAANRQPHAASRRFFARLKNLKNAEDLLGVLRFDSNAVIGEGEQPFGADIARGNLNARRILGAITN